MMYFLPLIIPLLFCLFAIARSEAPKAPPTINSLGTLQALKYNYLDPWNNGTAALLAYEPLSSAEARVKCGAIGESLYPFQDTTELNRTELGYELDYLVHIQDLQPGSALWIGSSGTSGQSCMAYSQEHKAAIPLPCDAKLPTLCTSSVPPTDDKHREPVKSSRISMSVDGYTITGYRDARSFRFLGIPFADPPVNELRFAPPQPYTGQKEIDATKLPASCIQSQSGFGTLESSLISEDCLYLNVYTPVLPSQPDKNVAHRPVAVYFYGGGFTKGSTAMIDYDGGSFASRNDIVVVTVNYRVGALGWLTTENLTAGSYGTRDQILALKWVQQYITTFGGDPSRVTIFGQSAGGQSVIAMLSSSAASGLFSAAVVQSAALDVPWYSRKVYTEIITPRIAKAVGCDDADEPVMLSCLRSIPAAKYLDNSTELAHALDEIAGAVGNGYLHTKKLQVSSSPFMPIVDDRGSGIIDDQFHTLLATNRLPNAVPIMFTTVTDEAALYVDRYVPHIPLIGSTNIGLDIFFSAVYPSSLATSLIKSGAFPINYRDPDSLRNTGADALTHSKWFCPQAYLLHHGARTVLPHLYTVQIQHGHVQTTADVPKVCSPNDNYNATCHTADVLPIWGTLNAKTQNVDPYYGPRDISHSQMLNDIFSSFFRTHNPNPDPELLKIRGPAYSSTLDIFGLSGYHIPEYQTDDESLFLLGMPPSQIQNPVKSDKCDVFTNYGYPFQHAEYSH
ncbi:cholinesterase [Aspergillus nomiae NRRL 13137]|uniref:Cholinesterase n=1 Tax=Aspergillus nomiae NRRL (strain ATCC 15546 / NRRL 13137 / CBS 260.88 / M93) TaxID=1509407 RepID=A0A0L1IYC6_ASPN3|nr:cholinesterase [Aspergillus nomiae NRRL 13137]KNG84178.1 cholinesterase [Aspergillus nomiae NRRL 13137]